MKIFIRNFLIGTTLLFGFLFGYMYWYTRTGQVNEYYGRFLGPAPRSIILGGSRAAMGVDPSQFSKLMTSSFEGPLFNYGFTLHQAVYGPWYLKAVLRKLDPETQNGLFILCIDPWTLNHYKSDSTDSENNFREKESFVSKMYFPNSNPNFEYLLFHYNKPLGTLFWNAQRPQSDFTLHKDGWLEIHKGEQDSLAIRKQALGKIYAYQKIWLKENRLSEKRLFWLKKMIITLKNKGKVILVRLPTSDTLAALEKENFPNFDRLILAIAEETHTPYYNWIDSSALMLTTDGNHLNSKSTQYFSGLLAQQLQLGEAKAEKLP